MSRSSKLSQRELDDAFENFLKESVSDDSLDSARLNQIFQRAKEPQKEREDGSPWWEGRGDDLDETPDRQTPMSSKWLKPKKQSTPLLQVDEEEEETGKAEDGDMQDTQEGSGDAGLLMKKYSEGLNPQSKESTYTDPLEDSGPGLSGGPRSLTGPGIDTLEEMEDKARFFKQLETKHGGTSGVDYSALNQQTSGTMRTLPTGFMGTADDLSSPQPMNIASQGRVPSSSESEETSDTKTDEKNLVTKPALLAKVSLLETGDSTLNIPRIKGPPVEDGAKRPFLLRTDSQDRGFDATGTTSEMEALHAAMRDAANTPTLSFNASHSKRDSGDIRLHSGDGEAQNPADEVPGDRHGEPPGKSARTVDDIIKEVMEEKLRKEMELREKNLTRENIGYHGDVNSGSVNVNNSANGKDSANADDYESNPGSRRDRREQKSVNLSPVFSDPEPRMSGRAPAFSDPEPRMGGGSPSRESTEEEEEVYVSGEGEKHQSSDDFVAGGDNFGCGDTSRPEKGDDRIGDGILQDGRHEAYGGDTGISSKDDGSEGGNRGFDLRPAPVVDSMGEQRGVGLAPAVLSVDCNRQRLVSADDETSVGSKTATPKRGPGKGGGGKKKTRFSDVKSSGYGQKRKSRPKEDVWSPADKVLQKRAAAQKSPSPNQPLSRNLLRSVESFATYIQENYSDQQKLTPPPEPTYSPEEPILSASLRDSRVHSLSRERALVAEINEWQSQWKDERRLNAKLKAEMASLHREQTRKLEEQRLGHDKELHRLRQDNVVLQAKINSQDDTAAVKTRLQGLADLGEEASSEEKAVLLQKEIVEQETLLQGYQQENERLYNEVKKLKGGGKENEEKLLQENQRLNTQVGNLREIIEAKDLALRNKGVITGEKAQAEIAAGNTAVMGAGRIAELQSEIKESGFKQSQFSQKIDLLEVTNHELRGQMDHLTREKRLLEAKIEESDQLKQGQFQDVLAQHKHEVEGLQKKLKWYAENQDLLDKDSAALRDKDETIGRLREELGKQSKQIGTKTSDAQRRAREKAADAKKIQDLERQVKEMNEIIRRRHPNSIPALMLAAAAATSDQRPPDSPVKSHTTAFLEERVKRLEGELDRKDDEIKRSLRAMEQKHSSIKIQYEERIEHLEEEAKKSSSHPHSTVTALERELEGARERYNKEIEGLREENNRLKQKRTENNGDQATKMKKKNKEYLEKIRSLEGDLESRGQEIEMLKSSCDKLMQDKLKTWTQSEKTSANPLKKTKKMSALTEEQSSGKTYEPETFAGSHISDVLQENETIKQKIEVLSLEIDQQRVRHQAALADAESDLRRAQEGGREEVRGLESKHRAEMETVIAEKALALADSEAARLKRQVESQKSMIKHLQDQLSEGQVTSDLLAASRVKEELHRTKMEQLKVELVEAKRNHTPEMRHFEALQSKIIALENRRSQRETDLERMVEKATQSAVADKNKEIMQYKDLVLQKNLEIERFRAELDGILDVLRELQRQGVVLPSYKQKESVLL